MYRLRAGDRIQKDMTIADGQIIPAHQPTAEAPRLIGMFEEGLVERAGRQHHQGRIFDRRQRTETVAQPLEERCQRPHPGRGQGIAEQAGGNLSVGKRIAHAARCLRAVRQRMPAPIRQPDQIDRQQMQPNPLGRVCAMQGSQKTGICQGQAGRQHPLAKQPLRTVEIGQNGIQQPGALGNRGFQPRPFRGGQHQRQRVEAPGSRSRSGIFIDRVADADLTDQAFRFHGHLCQMPRVIQAGRGKQINPGPAWAKLVESRLPS